MLRSLLLSTALLVASPAVSFDLNNMSETETTQFNAAVRAYLLDNPEVLLEAMDVLEERSSAAQAAGDDTLIQVNSDALFNDDASFVGGNPDAEFTIVEFIDYRCGYCRKAHDEVAELLKDDGNIRWIVKELPILGEDSVVASRFAIATLRIAGPEAYHAIHDTLMTSNQPMVPAILGAMAVDAGLDGDAIIAEMNSDAVTEVIVKNRELAQRMQINGTPSFVFGPQMLRGYVPLDGMRQLVGELRG